MQGADANPEELRTRSILYLCGIKHSGKSTLGRRLAEDRGLAFYDADELTIAAANQNTAGGATSGPGGPFRSARQLYRAVGPRGFKELEATALKALIEADRATVEPHSDTAHPAPHVVVALGGGVGDNPEALALISRSGYLVYLYVDADILYERIMRRGTPAFLTTENPKEEFEELFRRRDAAYRSSSDLVVELTGLGVPEAQQQVDTELRRHISGWQ